MGKEDHNQHFLHPNRRNVTKIDFYTEVTPGKLSLPRKLPRAKRRKKYRPKKNEPHILKQKKNCLQK
jgi:hypothetical protein